MCALCLYGYSCANAGEIAFASPKINPTIEKELTPLLEELSDLLEQFGLNFSVTLCCNGDFEAKIKQPILQKSKNIADTSELFPRSVQMFQLFMGAHGPTETVPNPTDYPPVTKAKPVNNGKANSRIPKWATSPTQNNYKIIRAYLQLFKEHGHITHLS